MDFLGIVDDQSQINKAARKAGRATILFFLPSSLPVFLGALF